MKLFLANLEPILAAAAYDFLWFFTVAAIIVTLLAGIPAERQFGAFVIMVVCASFLKASIIFIQDIAPLLRQEAEMMRRGEEQDGEHQDGD